MKQIILATLLLATAGMQAQDNRWSKPQEATAQQRQALFGSKEKVDDSKYLAGAVPEENGKVVFRRTIKAPGKTAAQVYELLLPKLQQMAREEGQVKSEVAIVSPTTHEIGATFEEWMVFKKSALVLDRTRFYYTLHAKCSDGAADVTINRLRYLYEEERAPQKMTAEEWISDREALNKKQTKLVKLSAKFRRKTVDRMEEVFNEITDALK